MKILRVIIIVILVLMAVPREVWAKDYGYIYFYSIDEYGESSEKYYEVSIDDFTTANEKAEFLIEKLILNENNDITYIPKYTGLLWVKIYENVCVINLSKEGFFSGGRYSEDRYVNQLLKTVWSLEEIDSIILYIEGKYSNLSGGVDFSAYSRDSNVLLEGSGVID